MSNPTTVAGPTSGCAVALIVDNRTTSYTVTLNPPTTMNQTGGFSGGSYVVPPQSGEQKIPISMATGLFTNAAADNFVMPFTIEGDTKCSDGTVHIFTAGGTHYPDLIMAEITCDGSTVSSQISTTGSQQLGQIVTPSGVELVGTFYVVFTDAGTQTGASASNSILSAIPDVMIGLLLK